MQRVGECAEPRRTGRKGAGRDAEGRGGQLAHRVAEQHFFAEADDETAQTGGETVERRFAVDEFGSNRFVAHDRPGDELRKERNVGRDVQNVFLRGRTAEIDVENVAHALECEEGNADGHDDFGERNLRVKKAVDIFHGKSKVFIVAEQAEVQND